MKTLLRFFRLFSRSASTLSVQDAQRLINPAVDHLLLACDVLYAHGAIDAVRDQLFRSCLADITLISSGDFDPSHPGQSAALPRAREQAIQNLARSIV